MREQANRTIRRTFEVLDFLDGMDRPVRLKDVMAAFGYPAASASDVLKSLVVLGYLNYDRDSLSYTLTPRITTLGRRLNEALWQDGAIMDALHALSAAFGAAVGLGMQSDTYAQYITVLPATRPTPYQLRPGAIRPVTRCGMGWALLSKRGDAEVERLRRRVNAQEDDPALHVDAATLAGWVGAVRQTGFAFSRHTFRPHMGIIAMPLPDRVGGRWTAIGVAGSVAWLDGEADRITAELARVVPAISPSRKSAGT